MGVTFDVVFVFILPLLSDGQHTVMALVADGTLSENLQPHCMHDALIINVSFSKVRYGLLCISFDLAMMEVIHA